ncbi:serine/threonine-protein kinase [Streptosporangium sp. NPDC087985]|uniref:serine/threonine-protein kinase n=1 Tax=Streptosporangium sp. NPDC087985 TaxID=3366196 RepID=UPI003822169D
MNRIDSRVLAGRYRLLNPLSEGGMGTVWLAADETLGRDVAVKEVRLPPDLDPARREEICAAALQEANLAARLKHPSIVTVHDVVVEQERPWLIMELLSGASLEQTVRERQPLPVRQVARVGVGILSALAAAHAAGVVHRDVKPGNVFLTRTGRAVLTDFGIAVVEGEATAGDTSHLVGSPNYIAPERLRGERGGPASDLWSLGATLYFAVEGMPPHPAETPISAISRVLTEPARPPERAGALGPLLMLMLAPTPGARPSFDAVAQALQEIALGRPAAALPAPSRPEPVPLSPAPASLPPVPVPSPVLAPSSALASRRGRTVLWAVAEVAVVAVVIGATMGVTHLAAGRTDPEAPVKLSEKPGAFATPVNLCKLVPAATVKELLPALRTEGQATNGGGCQWTTSGLGLEVAPSGTAKQWGKSPRQAHELFVNQRHGTLPSGETAWSWSDIDAGVRSARATGPLEVRSVGDEAFGYDLYENRRTGRLEQSHVVLRVDNLVVNVSYTVVDGSKDGPTIQAGTHTAATWIANALNKQKATPR